MPTRNWHIGFRVSLLFNILLGGALLATLFVGGGTLLSRLSSTVQAKTKASTTCYAPPPVTTPDVG